MSRVHPTAIVEDGAQIGGDVFIGPHCIIGPEVVLRDGVRLEANVLVKGRTTIGERTAVWPFAVIGGEPQDLGYRGEETEVHIGSDCLIREYVTIHRGTGRGRGRTMIGAKCFLMIGAHIAHDCIIGDNVILTNQATVGGHCELGDFAILGGLSAVQQRLHIGAHAFVAGLAGIRADVIPYGMAIGTHAQLAGLNIIGLKRRGFDRKTLHALRSAYRLFFFGDGTRGERLATVRAAHGEVAAIAELAAFIEARGDRPLTLPREPRTDCGD